MAQFEEAIPSVLKHEGLFSDNPADPGGATKYGISLRYLKLKGIDIDHDGDSDVQDIHQLTLEQAVNIYREHFWNRYQYSAIGNQRVANKLFDMSVNLGQSSAVKLIQSACNKIRSDAGLALDGIMGDKTLAVINSITPLYLLNILRDKLIEYYRLLVAKNPNLKIFLAGWVKRANSL